MIQIPEKFPRKKARGQHFLVDENILSKIVDLAQIKENEIILEVGAGTGNLTKHLLNYAKKVYAVEVEPGFVSILKEKFKEEPKLIIIEADILKFDLSSIKPQGSKLKVVSNLPYKISTELIFRFLELKNFLSELYLMLQLEVAQRVVASPGTKDYGILSVISQLFSDVEILLKIGPSAFKPKPKVSSAFVKFSLKENPLAELPDYRIFKRLVKAGFGKRRKILKNSLFSSGLFSKQEEVEKFLISIGISPFSRAEELSVSQWVQIGKSYAMKERSLDSF